MIIPISDITILRERQRKEMNPKKLSDLAESIKGRGLLHPIVVRRPRPEDAARNNGQPVHTPWVLVAGERRTAAHIVLGKTDIDASIKEDLPPLEQELCELEENLEREDISWQDEVQARARIHSLKLKLNPNQTASATAAEIGMTKGNFSKDMALNTMMQHDPELKAQPTKRAALRLAEHKVQLASRVLKLSETNEEDLRKKLFTADFRDFIRILPNQSIDLIFTDLPYAIDYKSMSEIGDKSLVMGKYDDDPEVIKDMVADLIPQMCRVLKPSGWMVLFFSIDGMDWLRQHISDACAEHGGYWMGQSQTGPGRWCDEHAGKHSECRFLTPSPIPWVWYKPNARTQPQWPDRYAKHMYEQMLVVNGGQARMVIQNQPDVLVHDAIYENRLHEMQKPHQLCVDVIRRLTVPGEVVADFSFGSGQHLASAASLGRDFIGCDNNPDNLKSAIGLIFQYYSPESLKAAKAGLENSQRTREELEDEEAVLSKL